jgi:NAD(P)-dependent dehydrogenase (short-subunit alcohol dehydrogenase family)
MTDIFSLKNKVIIITGAGKGIGNYLANKLSQEKAIVYAIDITFSNINKILPTNPFQIKCDITNKKKFYNVCKLIYKNHKKIDILINNAGLSFPSKSEVYDAVNWEKTLAVNLTASYFCSLSVIDFMKKNKSGSIVNITSLNAEQAFPKNPAYVASKGGLKMLGKSLAKDWGKFGIRVNNLGPGYIKTDMTKKSFRNKKTRIEREKQTLLGRWGEIEDLVGPCIFLASDASNYVTGQDIYVDGGWLANGGISI